MTEIYLSVNNNAEIMEIPVIPSKISIGYAQETATFETASGKDFPLLTPQGIKTISWQSFFPAKDYTFVRGTRLSSPFDYSDMIEKWQRELLPVRLVIWLGGSKKINVAAVCKLSTGEIGTTGDMDYDIEFSVIPTEIIEETITMAQYEELTQKITDLENKIEEYHKKYTSIEQEDFPGWAQEAVGFLYGNGTISVDESAGLDLTYDMLRAFVINYRAQAYRNTKVYNYVDANMGEYEPYMRWLANKGYIKGDENGLLNLTEDMMRILVVVMRLTDRGPWNEPLED